MSKLFGGGQTAASGGILFFSSSRRHTSSTRDWSSDVCSSDLQVPSKRRGSHGFSCYSPCPPGTPRSVPGTEPASKTPPGGRRDTDRASGPLRTFLSSCWRKIGRASCRERQEVEERAPSRDEHS